MAIDVNNPTVGVTIVPTVQAAAYSSGNVIGGLLTLTGASRVAIGTGLVQSVTCTFSSGVTPSLDLILFSANPSGSTVTDKTALAIVAADLAKIEAVIHLTDATSLGSTSIMQSQQQAVPFEAATLYGVLVTRAAATLTSVTDATLTINVLQS